MTKKHPTLLPEGTVLTTEGRDKILTGKLQRAVVRALVESDFYYLPTPEQTVANLVKEMSRFDKVAPQNVHRTLKVLEEKGVLRLTKLSSGSATIAHAISSRMTGEMTADGCHRWEYYINDDVAKHLSAHDVRYAADVVGHVDFVAAIKEAFQEKKNAAVFKTVKLAKEGSTRWFITEFNKPSLFALAARAYSVRVNDNYGEIPRQLIAQAARGAWQPFFDTLKTNKVISYHDLQEGRVMVWDARRWAVYSARVMQQREAIIYSWETE
ncbi:hypothetical protein BTN33_07620 [Aeromonas veronii]|uniref:hypothetical protein n=1 Tax=Aeromonas veronii TaxID=654 RepID=UPI0009472C10|nr:hypothetical protein [Aeromonas veronii]OLF59655.1 hypothetical protein BTN33_07620 [Aeromonas veronii]